MFSHSSTAMQRLPMRLLLRSCHHLSLSPSLGSGRVQGYQQSRCRIWTGVRTMAANTPSSGVAAASPSRSQGQQESWEIKMLYDGGCPLCMREVNMLRRRDEGAGKIVFVDIDAPDYDPSDNAGITYEQGMANIHAILPDGKVVTNVEVFRRLYEAVGLGWVYAITKQPLIGRAAEAVYGVWAKYRMQITGRPDLDVILQQKKTCR